MKENLISSFVSAVVYARDEEGRIGDFLAYLSALLAKHFQSVEIVCVNDASADGTEREIREFSARCEAATVQLINLSFFQGLERAMNAGMDLAIGDYVYEFDTLTLDYPSDMPIRAYEALVAGSDIVSAAPDRPAKPVARAFYRVFNRHSGDANAIRPESFRLLPRRAINRVRAMSAAVPFRKVAYARSGLKLETLVYPPGARSGRATGRAERSVKAALAIDALAMYTSLFYRFALWMTAIFMAASVGIALYAAVVFFGAQPIEGWTTTMLFLSFSFFGLFAILTIVIKYLSLLVELNMKKQPYTVRSIEKLN